MKKYEKIILTVFAAAVLLLAGFWLGRNSSRGDITVSVSTMPSETSLPPAEEETVTRALPEQTDTADAPGQVNINTAAAQELMSLPGIGESLADRIIEYRSKYGPFRSAEELLNVNGIGEKKLKAIEDQITV